MKTLEIIRFELFYRSKRPVNYIYFILLFVIAFLFSRLGIKGISEVPAQVKENAPLIIHQLTALLNLPLLILTSAVMGVSVIRDFDSQMEQLLFTNPISKNQYLTGRFLGSLLTMFVLTLAIPLGAMAGELASAKPASEFLPFTPLNYINSYLIIVLPNILFLSAFFFAGGAISKKTIVIYAQGILLLILISIADEVLIETAQNLQIATLFDFYTFQLYNLETKYWSAVEINTQLVPITTSLIWNRLIYLGIGAIALILTYWRFQSSTQARKSRKASNS